MRSAISSSRSTPRAISMRRSEPNWLISTGTPFAPFTFSNSSAGPPGRPYFLAAPLETRSAISVISSTGSTSVRILLSSPARSSAAIQSLRSLYGNLRSSLSKLVANWRLYKGAPASNTLERSQLCLGSEKWPRSVVLPQASNLADTTHILPKRAEYLKHRDPMATAIQNETQYIDAFLKLTLRPTSSADVFPLLHSLTEHQRRDFVELAGSNHVVIRAFEVINRVAGNRNDSSLQAWAMEVLSQERARTEIALRYLEKVCNALEGENCPTVVMKTLDHWPDLGNDLDLVSTGQKSRIVQIFTQRFNARIEARSWGDRLACKWNFA